ncbi:MAG: two-component system response regulator [Acidobacteriota bacterium]
MSDDPVNILLVDDLQTNLTALEAVLQPSGENLLFARSGKEALELAARHDLAVAVLDLHMPEMDGFETAARLRALETGRQTPIIFVTASYVEEINVARAYALGAVDYLIKPFSPEVLLAKVSAYVQLYRRTCQDQIRLEKSYQDLRSQLPGVVSESLEGKDHPAILVVNDNPAQLEAFRSALADLDAEILCAGSGREALSLLLKRAVALILLDIHMPDINGFEIAALVRDNKRFQQTPF